MSRFLKKQNKLALISGITLALLPLVSYADPLKYNLLEPLGTLPAGQSTTFSAYLGEAYIYLISGAGVVAVVMLAVAGAQYAARGVSEAAAKGAEDKIWNVVYGLLGAITAYFVLSVINPNLVTFDLDRAIPALGEVQNTPTITGPNFSPTGSVAAPVAASEGQHAISTQFGDGAAVRKELGIGLTGSHIFVNHDNPCVGTETTGCTTLAGLGSNAVKGIEQTQAACNCDIMITGGTEAGHATHGPGKDIVDLRATPQLTDFVTNTYTHDSGGRAPRVTSVGTEYPMANGDIYRLEDKGTSNEHWHVIFQALR